MGVALPVLFVVSIISSEPVTIDWAHQSMTPSYGAIIKPRDRGNGNG